MFISGVNQKSILNYKSGLDKVEVKCNLSCLSKFIDSVSVLSYLDVFRFQYYLRLFN